MKRLSKLIICFALMLACMYITKQKADGWGFYAHKEINKLAVYTLPTPLFTFYKKHVTYLSDHAVDADKRRHLVPQEAPRHYIDLDRYNVALADSLPLSWQKAVEKYTSDTLLAHGTLPWHLNLMMYKLTEAFKEKNTDKILYYSANLGHYVGDAHVPLHTTSNYNGQKTNQHGIHGLWESRLPELYGNRFEFWVGKATYIENTSTYIRAIIFTSHQLVDSVLKLESTISKQIADEQKYAIVTKGQANKKTYSETFSKAYHEALNGMVERQMKSSVKALGNLWYTAWINAGQPNLFNDATIPYQDSTDQYSGLNHNQLSPHGHID